MGSAPRGPTPTVKCSVCDTSFARQEHLTRHIRTHTREKPFSCDLCGKAFSRLDVLNRHAASHDDSDGPPRTPTSARACKECAAGRVRCSRTQPCRRCDERSLSCEYPMARKRRVSALSGAGENGIMGHDLLPPGFSSVTTGSQSTYDAAMAGGGMEDRGDSQADVAPEQLADQVGFATDGLSDDSVWMNAMPNVNLHPSPTSLYRLDQPGLGISAVNWMSPLNPQVVGWDTQLADFTVTSGGALGQAGFPFCLTDTEAIAPGNGWSAQVPGTSPGVSANGSRPNSADDSEPSDSVVESTASASTNGKYYVDGTGARAPFGGRSNTHRFAVSLDSAHERDCTATSRSAVASSTDLAPNAACENMRERMIIEARHHSSDIGLEHLPSSSDIQLFVRHYFDKFHPVFPFLRRASFPRECSQNWVLLLAVATVGSRYLRRVYGEQPGAMLMQNLERVLERLLHRPGLSDDSIPFVPGEPVAASPSPSIYTLQASILTNICMLHSGKRSQVERAFRDRHYLVEACHGLGLLHRTRASQPSEPEDVEGIERWLRRESRIRTGMMIWLLDAMFVYEFDGKPLIRLNDVEAPLPSRDDIWEAPDLRCFTTGKVTTMLLHDALEMLYMEKRLPPNLGDFSTGLLINAIYRKTKEAVIWEQTQLNSWTPTAAVQRRARQPPIGESWPPTTPTLSKWRNSACDGLDLLHWPANSKAASLSGAEHHSILHLHLSRLILLTPATHIQTFAASSSTTQLGEGPRNKYVTARKHILQWAARDQFKARLSVIHCGALFWHVRRYSRDSVMEPFAIYIATLILWAYCVSLQFSGQSVTDSHASYGTQTVESSAAAPNEPGPERGNEDLPEPSFIHLDRPLDDELVQAFVRLGHKMSGYIMRVGNIRHVEAPQKVLLEGIRLLKRVTQSDAPADEDTQQSDDRPHCTWGIESSFIEMLGRLVRATTGVHNEDT